MKYILDIDKYTKLNESMLDGNMNDILADWGAVSNAVSSGLYGFSYDPNLSTYPNQYDSTVDPFTRNQLLVKGLRNQVNRSQSEMNDLVFNKYLKDIEELDNIKILRMFVNNMGFLDVFISFELFEIEFFGVFRSFNNTLQPIIFTSELYTDVNFSYINEEYRLKLSNHLKMILDNWFNPMICSYKSLKNNTLRDLKGGFFEIKKDAVINIVGTNIDANRNKYAIVVYKDNKYFIKDNDFYYINYRYEKIKDTIIL